MPTKLTAIGGAYGIIIDQAILDLLRITPETELELSTDGTRLIVAPAQRPRAPRRPAAVPPKPEPPKRPDRPSKPEPRYGFPKKQPW